MSGLSGLIAIVHAQLSLCSKACRPPSPPAQKCFWSLCIIWDSHCLSFLLCLLIFLPAATSVDILHVLRGAHYTNMCLPWWRICQTYYTNNLLRVYLCHPLLPTLLSSSHANMSRLTTYLIDILYQNMCAMCMSHESFKHLPLVINVSYLLLSPKLISKNSYQSKCQGFKYCRHIVLLKVLLLLAL